MAMPGGFSDVPVTNKAVIAAAEFAVETKATQLVNDQQSDAVQMKLLQILRAQQQIVSGVNYKLKVEVSLNGKEKMAETVVWWQAWRQPDPYVLTSWSWDTSR